MKMDFKTWVSNNKPATALLLFFIIGLGTLGWLTMGAWDALNASTAEYNDSAAKLKSLSEQKPFPSSSNLQKLKATLDQSKANLEKLLKELSRYRIPPFGDIVKSKPSDQPQVFQDVLRAQVTEIKTLAANSGSTLEPSFYLGFDEYENRLPSPEQVLPLARQLTVLDWLAGNIVSQKGAMIAEFARIQTDPPLKKSSPAKKSVESSATDEANSSDPYQTAGVFRITLRCDQSSFRNIVNTISSAPYFLIIESIQIQNSNGEPPRRDTAPQSAQQSSDATTTVQRLPIIVGREVLNVFLRIRAIDFPELQHSPEPLK